MKKYFLSIVALAAMLFATSCQESLVEPQMEGPTTFTVQLPDGMGTKAIGDKENVNQLLVAVYSDVDNDQQPLVCKTVDVQKGTGRFDVSFDLIKGQTYDLIFWAQTANAYVQGNDDEGNASYDLRTIDIANRFYSNENGAAFYAYQTYVIDGQPKEATLRRPFAQLNIGTTVQSLKTDADSDIILEGANIEVRNVASSFNTVTGFGEGTATIYGETDLFVKVAGEDIQVNNNQKYAELKVEGKSYVYVTMDYLPIISSETVPKDLVEIKLLIDTDQPTVIEHNFDNVPVQRNYRTNIVGNLISSTTDFNVTVDDSWAGPDYKYDSENGKVYVEVETVEELQNAINDGVDEIILSGDINLNGLLQTKSEVTTEDPTLTIKAGKTLTIDLNGKKLSATSSQTGKNYNMFQVRGTLTVKNGTMEYEHIGENMLWNNSTNLFDVAAGGVLNLEGVTATNLGGSDMGFVVHLNNWGEVTLNAENCTLVSNYVPVRVFNSGYDMNNVTIKNSTLTGGSASFWVHNYTKEDFGSQEKADSQKELLNLNIYNQGNTFSPDLNGIRYGFTNSIRTDAYGITKVVSEDGTEVTLGSLIENGLVRRGVAGDEENTTIKKVVVEEGITTLYDRAFRRFYALEEVVLPEGLTTIGEAGSGVFQSCTALKNIVIPESVTVLGKGTFQECSSLESINIPSRVTRIEENCLRATGLVSVEFHADVTYFGAQAFRDCKQLKEVIITAPDFTIEANAFGVMAGTLPGTTIYVANAEMQSYLESTLAYKNQFTIEVIGVSDVTSLDSQLNAGGYVILTEDLTFSATETDNTGYGAAGVIVKNGAVLDGQGHTLKVNDAWTTWDCAIAATGGTIKNLTVSSAMRGIFMPGADGDVYINNVIFDNVIYTFNSDAGNKNYGVYISNSTLNGWTSHSDVHKEVVYTNCKFGKGNGYAFCRPYGPTSFVGCNFEDGFAVDAIGVITFENCTIGGVALTAENLETLVISGIGNATVK